MMNFHKFFLCFVVIFCVAGMTIPAHAEVKMGVVDVEILLNQSKAGKSVQEQLKSKRDQFQKEFADKEKNLRDDEKKLIEKKDKISADEFAAERKKFEEKLLETRKLLQTRKASLDKGLSSAMQELRENIMAVTADIAEKEKYQLILNRDSIVIVEKSMDITQSVLSKLDAKISSIKLKVE
jgi:Skp family chaperone for outer membrane proteins